VTLLILTVVVSILIKIGFSVARASEIRFIEFPKESATKLGLKWHSFKQFLNLAKQQAE
jgi:hypothetical protein